MPLIPTVVVLQDGTRTSSRVAPAFWQMLHVPPLNPLPRLRIPMYTSWNVSHQAQMVLGLPTGQRMPALFQVTPCPNIKIVSPWL